MLRRASDTLAKLLSIRPGEGAKTLLLFSLHLVFYVGIRWGDSAGQWLFAEKWGSSQMPLTLAGNAVLAVIIGVAYSVFAGRVSGQRMLYALCGLMVVWLGSVRLLFEWPAANGERGLVYPYFYIAGRAFSDLAALHLLNYISDFYDTRAAKRVLPLMLSASIAGGIVANFSYPALADTIRLPNIALAWAACLLAVIGFALLIRRRLPAELAQLERPQPARRAKQSTAADSLRANVRIVAGSGILRWLAVSTFLMVVLMGVLNVQSTRIIDGHFQGNSVESSKFSSIADGVFNIAGVVFSSLLFSRLVSRFGVGSMNLVFPLIVLFSVGAIHLPGLTGWIALGAAVVGRSNDRMFKKVLRNSLDPMLFNSVPQHVKARARGFINSTMVPLGTLVAALLTGALTANLAATPTLGLAIGLSVALLYLASSWLVRREYSRALVKLLDEDETAIFRASQADFEAPDPNMIRLLEERLRESQDEHIVVFLAETLYDFRGREALPLLQELAEQRGATARAGIIQIIGSDLAAEPAVRRLCLGSLRDRDAVVRRAAATALAGMPNIARDEEALDAFVDVVNRRDEATQSVIIPPLLASGEFYYLMPAVSVLYGWLSDKRNSDHRALGLRVLSKTGDARLIRRLARFLEDPDPEVRSQAAYLIADLMIQTPLEDMKTLGLETLGGLIKDEVVSVRLAAVEGLGRVKSIEASRMLLTAMRDPSIEVRRQACTAIQVIPSDELGRALGGQDMYLAECAAIVLARTDNPRIRRRVLELCEAMVANAYALHIDCLPLREQGTPGARLLEAVLREHADRYLERVLWLVNAFGSERAAESIRRSLRQGSSAMRANALETLEAVTSPQLAQLISPLLEDTDPPALARLGQTRLGLGVPSLWHVCHATWPQVREAMPESAQDGAKVPIESDDWLAAVSMLALAEMIRHNQTGAADRVREVLESERDARAGLLRETAQLALAQLEPPKKRAASEQAMMTLIERVIFLKEVPFFEGMSIDDLRLLAGIAETETAGVGQKIVTEGERGEGLYVIVSGRVAVQHSKQTTAEATLTTLATLGPREYFAEMSIFDEEPASADVVAMTPTQLLLVRRAPVLSLIRRQPDLALGLFRVLSQRLRQANALLAKKQRA